MTRLRRAGQTDTGTWYDAIDDDDNVIGHVQLPNIERDGWRIESFSTQVNTQEQLQASLRYTLACYARRWSTVSTWPPSCTQPRSSPPPSAP